MSGLVKLEAGEPQREFKKLKLVNPLVELRKWAIFSNVDPHLLSNVKMAHVFGNSKTTGLLVTEEDEVYSIGNNKYGRLGIGSDSPSDSSLPLKVEALCGKKVSSFSCFSYSGPINGIFLALTQTGQVYAWGGSNIFGSLGLGTTTSTFFLVPTLVEGLRDKRIVQLSCGYSHSLALTSDGEVYSWGFNGWGQVGNGTTLNQSTPLKVSDVIGDIEISTVSCGVHHSVSLSKAGEIFIWGVNVPCQLGNGSKSNAMTPVKVTLPENECVVKITCGPCHTMALTKSGKLYIWGSNGNGELGNGTTTDSSSLVQVQGLGPVKDIAAINYLYPPISVCATESNKVYVWGNAWGNKLTEPNDTGLQSIEDAFWVYSKPQVMHQPLVIESVDKISPSLAQDLENAFNDKFTADVEFFSESESENKRIYVHKSILQIRSIYFRTMFAERWKESGESRFEIDPSISFSTFHVLLFFLYTDRVEFPHDDLKNIMDLLKLADLYMETRLREECESILKRGIAVENVVEFFSVASKHNTKVLEEFACKFILSHRGQIPFEEELE